MKGTLSFRVPFYCGKKFHRGFSEAGNFDTMSLEIISLTYGGKKNGL
jgi:uncharacterized protein YifE (UPF0438 family)